MSSESQSTLDTDTPPTTDDTDTDDMEDETDDINATITGSTQDLRKMVVDASLLGGGDPVYDRLYLNIANGELNLVGGTHSGGVMSYCTYSEGYFKEIDGSIEAVINVVDFLNYLDIASDGGQLTLNFRHDDDSRLAQQLEIRGKLVSSLMLPAGSSVLQNIPLPIVDRFDDENRMLSQDGDPLSTRIQTTAGDLQKIVDAVHLQDGESFYPVVVENGKFQLRLGNRQTQFIEGELVGDVEGDDVENEFADEFENIVDSIDGTVRFETSDGVLGCFVVDGGDYVTRTVMGVARS